MPGDILGLRAGLIIELLPILPRFLFARPLGSPFLDGAGLATAPVGEVSLAAEVFDSTDDPGVASGVSFGVLRADMRGVASRLSVESDRFNGDRASKVGSGRVNSSSVGVAPKVGESVDIPSAFR